MSFLSETTWFEDVPAGSFFEVWALTNDAGAIQCDLTFSNLGSDIPDVIWDNNSVHRTPMAPEARGRAQIVGPVACILFATILINAPDTGALVVLRVVDAEGTQIRRKIWDLHSATNDLNTGDILQGIHSIYLA